MWQVILIQFRFRCMQFIMCRMLYELPVWSLPQFLIYSFGDISSKMLCLFLSVRLAGSLSNCTASFQVCRSQSAKMPPSGWLFSSSNEPIKALPIVRPANDNLFILPIDQSHEFLACDCHCFNNCLITKVCAVISKLISYTRID